MRIGAVTLAYNDQDIIRGTLRCLKPFVDKHVVLISEKPYFGEAAEPDNTMKYCIEEDVEVIKGTWDLDHYQRNVGSVVCSDCDWIIGFDSDEMMTSEQLERFIAFLGRTDAVAVCNTPKIYWGTTSYILKPYPGYQPIIAYRPSVKFTYIRNIDSPFVEYHDPMHHLSWCKPKDIYKKIKHYAHANDYDWESWYHNVYEKWSARNPEVVFPGGDKYTAVYEPLPEELKCLL